VRKGERHTAASRARLADSCRAAWAGNSARRAAARERMRRVTKKRWAAWRGLDPAERDRVYKSGAFGGRSKKENQ